MMVECDWLRSLYMPSQLRSLPGVAESNRQAGGGGFSERGFSS